MKRETLEKIRNILERLFELFIFILIMLIMFGSLHVHAAESSYTHKYTLTWVHTVSNWKYPETRVCVYSSDAQFVIVRQESSNAVGVYSCFVKVFIQNDQYPNGILVNLNDSLMSGKFDWDVSYTKDNVTTDYHNQDNQLWFSHTVRKDVYSNGIVSESTVEADFPIFDSNDHALAYCKNGSTEGLLNGGSIDNPDFEDTAYAFTGFTANSKMTATWTGTTERSYLKDEDVDEYVRVSYGFAAKDAPDSIKQVDNDSTEYATASKSLTVNVSDLVPDDDSWFLRYVQVVPCYRQAGLGAWGDFYHGIPNVIYFNKDGSIEKIIQKTKPTDLNKGNMVYDTSIGYLQNVIYTEQKTHDGTGRQATFKWSTQKSLPSDAQVEIVAQNFYVEWFNKKTEENFVFKEYGEDCFYSSGSYSFNANTPVWTWLKEKEIDPFSVKTQSYGSTEYYLRIVTYDAFDSLYHYGGWVKVDIKTKDATNLPATDVETGGFDDSSGLWNPDIESEDSYHYSTDDEGKLTGNIDVNSWEDLNINSFTWMYRNMQSMVSSLGEFPTMVNTVFGYLPVQLVTAIGVLLVAIVLLRFLGR